MNQLHSVIESSSGIAKFIPFTPGMELFKGYHINFSYDAFPEFEFFEDDGSELFHDASSNVSAQCSYRSEQ